MLVLVQYSLECVPAVTGQEADFQPITRYTNHSHVQLGQFYSQSNQPNAHIYFGLWRRRNHSIWENSRWHWKNMQTPHRERCRGWNPSQNHSTGGAHHSPASNIYQLTNRKCVAYRPYIFCLIYSVSYIFCVTWSLSTVSQAWQWLAYLSIV